MEYQKTAEATGDLIGNKIVDVIAKSQGCKITEVWRSSPQNNSKTITSEHHKEIPKERYIFPGKRQKIINDLTFNMIV